MAALATQLTARLRDHSKPDATHLDLPALVGAAAWARLPPAVQRRFGTAGVEAAYIGHMELRCSHIGRFHAWVARLFGGPLTSRNASTVPTSVLVYDNGSGGVVWERRFHRDGERGERGARIVRSTKEIGADGGLQERTDGGLSMSLDVFEEDGSLVFRSRRFWLVLGRLRVPVPGLLTPGTCRVTHTDLGQGFFRFSLTMTHGLWGETFHQSGVFADLPCESTS